MARHQAAHSHPRRADTRYRRRGQSRGPRADEPTGTRRRVDPDALQRAARDPGHVRSHPGHASGPPDRRVHPRAGLAGGDHGLRRMTAVAAPIREPGTRPAVTRGLGNRFLQRYGTLLILLALCLVFTVIGPWRTPREPCNLWEQVAIFSLIKNGQLCGPVFASQVNILNLVRQVSVIGIVALGEMLVILTGGIDLGVGSLVGFTGMIAAGLQHNNAALVASFAVPMLIGALTGLVVGVLVTRGHIPSFVAT